MFVTHRQCDAKPTVTSSRKASPSVVWYQIILLGDGGTCVSNGWDSKLNVMDTFSCCAKTAKWRCLFWPTLQGWPKQTTPLWEEVYFRVTSSAVKGGLRHQPQYRCIHPRTLIHPAARTLGSPYSPFFTVFGRLTYIIPCHIHRVDVFHNCVPSCYPTSSCFPLLHWCSVQCLFSLLKRAQTIIIFRLDALA